MSKIHIFNSDGNGKYNAVLHTPVPAGNNSAGIPWSTVVINAGLAKTVLTVGNGAGQMTAVEKAEIDAGTTIELVAKLNVESGGATSASILALANTAISEFKSGFSAEYKYYGYTQG